MRMGPAGPIRVTKTENYTMANKHDNPEGTFRDMVYSLKTKDTGKQAAMGESLPWGGAWGKKAKTRMSYAFTGNEGKSNQLPLKKRKANLLKYMQTMTGTDKIYVNDIEPTVLKALIDDGDVYIENGKSGHIRQSHSYAVPTEKLEIVEGKLGVPYSKRNADLIASGLLLGEEKVETKTVQWTKERDQKLLVEIMIGTADEELVKEVNRTKTKMRKIKLPKTK